jgi:UDP-N-acetylmuramoylalanine--D-glutamate ligase
MKIAIAGYGIEGKENYTYWSADPANDLMIVDEAETPKFVVPVGAKTILGQGAFQKLDGFDLVIRTAGLAPNKIKTDGKIWSATNEFFAKCPAVIIGVTGTKGKGTTSSMIASMLEAAGKQTWLVGNIGTAALEVLPRITKDAVVVYEMSSFQLWDIESSPHIAVVLPIEPDHLNVHYDMEDYIQAKGRIRRFQTAEDICIYYPHNTYSRQIALSNLVAPMQRYGIADDGAAYVKEGAFFASEHIICSKDEVQVPGIHNIENACAAISAVLKIGISNDAVAEGLRNFKGLPHRIEFVRTLNGVDYYNDSFSSAPGATIAAIKAFTKPELVVLGGIDKGADFHDLIETIRTYAHVKELVLIGSIRHKLQLLLREAGISAKVTVCDEQTMPAIVSYLSRRAEPGDVVILSPACASFDMFRDFYDRGDQFRSVVKSL